ncbi:MAG: N-acetylmuramoyl-L-alanine amidase [Acidobacteria bacterium]|nr:N-acetylmuramoyl-L-alanine amidase [Acidobacteriota bacterium]
MHRKEPLAANSRSSLPANLHRNPPLWARAAGGAAAAAVLLLLARLVAGQTTPTPTPAPSGTGTIVWRGEAHPVALASGDLRVTDVAKALGFDVSTDSTTGVMTLSSAGHQVFLGVGTTQVPVDQRIVQISRQARSANGALHAPPDLLDRVLLPLVGATATYDAARRVWTIVEAVPALTIDVAVVHVEPTTQIVLKESTGAEFIPSLTENGFQIRWPDRKIVPPFQERRYEDPLISAIRFAGDSAMIEFRDRGLFARAYPLTSPDRLVIEVGRAAAPSTLPSAPAPAPVPTPAWTVVIDAGHGGTETGAIGPGGLQEKDTTLQIARRIASALPRLLSCRVLMTRDSDAVISLDDRTAVANHEKADLFLSVHANSSRASGAHGSETYYLSLEASDRIAQDVASRENSLPSAPAAAPAPRPAGGSPTLDFILWDLAQSAHIKDSSELAEAIQQELNGAAAPPEVSSLPPRDVGAGRGDARSPGRSNHAGRDREADPLFPPPGGLPAAVGRTRHRETRGPRRGAARHLR